MNGDQGAFASWALAAAAVFAAGCAGDRDRRAPPPGSAATAASADVQGFCPVTGEPLGSMGPPVAVAVDGKTVYVCCEGCVEPLRRKAAGRPGDGSAGSPAAGESIPFSSRPAEKPVRPAAGDGHDGHDHVH